MFDPGLFKGQVMLVTGATGGVGRATAQQLLACGATVCITAPDAGRLGALAQELGVDGIAGNVANVQDCGHIIDEVLKRHGRLDALVNCAGIWVQGDSETATESDWVRCLDINLKGTFFLCSRAIPALKASRGVIVNVSSDAGVIGNAGCAIYCASKGGVTLMSKSLALELAPFGIRVNALCPSDVMTPMLRKQAAHYGGGDPDRYLEQLLGHYPQRENARFIEAHEVASFIAFLLTNEAAPITGAALSMDFGLSAGY